MCCVQTPPHNVSSRKSSGSPNRVRSCEADIFSNARTSLLFPRIDWVLPSTTVPKRGR
jgi:hypothetical protein